MAPVPICLTDSSALVPKCLGFRTVSGPKCLYTDYSMASFDALLNAVYSPVDR